METNYFVEPEYPLWNKLKKGIRFYGNLTVAIYFTFLLLRLLEFTTLSITRTPPGSWTQVIALALVFDALTFLKISAFLSIPTLLFFVSFRYNRASYVFFGCVGSILIALYVCLIHYFESTLRPLGAEVYGYSLSEISQTIQSSGDFSVVNFFMIFFPIAIFWIVLFAFYLKPLVGFYTSLIQLLLGLFCIYFGFSSLPKTTWFKTEYEYNISINKLGFLLEKSLENDSKTHLSEPNARALEVEKTSFRFMSKQPILSPIHHASYVLPNALEKPRQ